MLFTQGDTMVEQDAWGFRAMALLTVVRRREHSDFGGGRESTVSICF
jgi:hypothetical protein